MNINRPNFVCIVADQLRFDLLGCAGHPVVRTPNIDKLAENGVRFTHCYTNQPMCMATRSTWLTGRTPRCHGVRCNGIPLRKDIPTITEALRNAGYKTHSIGKIHVNPWLPHHKFKIDELNPQDQEWPEAISLWENGYIENLPSPYYGFETTDALCGWWSGNYGQWLKQKEPNYKKLIMPPQGMKINKEGLLDIPEQTWQSRLPAELHYTHWATERFEKFLNSVKTNDNPFFLWLSIPDPHPPFMVAEPYYSMYRKFNVPEPIRREGELDTLPPHYKQIFASGVKTAGRIAKTNVPIEMEKEAIRTVYQDSSWTANINTGIFNFRRSTLSMPSSSQYDCSHFLYGESCTTP